MATLSELARAGALGAATGPPTNDPTLEQFPELTLGALARLGLLGPGNGQPELRNPMAGGPAETLTGEENRPPPGPPPSGLGAALYSMALGALNPLGLTPPDVTVMQSPGQTLTGRVLPLTPRTLSFRAPDPTAEAAGSMLGAGPMLRAGAAGLSRLNPRSLGLYGGATAGVGGVVALGEPGTSEAQRRPPASEEIKGEQRRLQREGLYQGDIDGYDGPATQAARRAYQELETQRAADRRQQQELDLQKAQSDADRERIRLEQQREERMRIEGERADRVAQEGMERFRNMHPTFMQEYGSYLGYPLGFAMGLGGRYGMSRVLNREARELSDRARTMGANMGTGDVPERVGRVNEFWATGGGRQPPFTFQPGREPFPWATNPTATAPSELYRSGSRLTTYGPGALTLGVGVGETGLGYAWLQNARRELEAAQAALSARDAQGRPTGMTPANVQRLEDARNSVAQAEFLMRTGMGTLAGGTVGELESAITRGRLRPATGAADAERGRLDQLLNPRPEGPPQPQPRWDANVNRWRLNGGFVRGPRSGNP